MDRYRILMTSCAVNIACILGFGVVMLAGIEVPKPIGVPIWAVIGFHLATNYVLARNGWWQEDGE